jgi:DNA ligase-1
MLCTPKLDGIRAIKQGRLLSRKFIEIPNEQIQHKYSWLPNGLDGELILVENNWSGSGFNKTQSIVMREEPISYTEIHSICYFIFDYVMGDLRKPYIERMADLEDLQRTCSSVGIRYLLPKKINNLNELIAYEQKCVDEGYEGVILRSPHSPYKLGRSTFREQYLMKLKRFEDSEAKITGFEERMHNANEMGRDNLGHAKRSSKKEGMVGDNRLGSLLVSDIHSGVEFSLGSGFDDSLREEIWNNQSKYLGALVKYKCQPSGAKDKPRFPVFLGFRDERDIS